MKSKHRTATRPPQPLPASLIERAAARARDRDDLEFVTNTAALHEDARRTWIRLSDDEEAQQWADGTMQRTRESLVRMANGANIREEYARRSGSRF